MAKNSVSLFPDILIIFAKNRPVLRLMGEMLRSSFSGFSKIILPLVLIFLVQLAGCAGKVAYYDQADAPDHIKKGILDPRLAVTQQLGEAFSPIVRNMRRPYGDLSRETEFKSAFLATIRPLDILAAKSSPGIVSGAIPSFFTHVAVWIGTKDQWVKYGMWNDPAFAKYQPYIEAGNVIIESSNDSVHLSDYYEGTHLLDEIVILRPPKRRKSQMAAIFKGLDGYLGTPFDTSFDVKDTSKLTCLELLNYVYPEINLLERYVQGRYAYIPDDLVRSAVENKSRLRFVTHFWAERGHSLRQSSSSRTKAVLTDIRPKPRYAFY